jgi:hypothetical protein
MVSPDQWSWIAAEGGDPYIFLIVAVAKVLECDVLHSVRQTKSPWALSGDKALSLKNS